ncbi:MAG: phosphatase PAP2 family protein [Bacteroidales bacterium]|nr:phosphatase PAP2 family protein [Candidatus Latescibacterota bacterium]
MNFRILIYVSAALVMMTFLPVPSSATETGDVDAPDLGAFRLLNGKAVNPFFDLLMPIVTDFRKWRIVLVLVWVALMIFGKAKGRWAALMMIPLVAATDQLCASLIKPLVGRMRPCEVLGGVHLWHGIEGWITTPMEVVRSYKSSFSFPSNHAANMTGAMLFLGLVYRKSLIYLLVIAFAVSYSRIYIGVHWPLDVLAGMIIGASLAFLAWTAFKWIYRPARKKQVETPGEKQ